MPSDAKVPDPVPRGITVPAMAVVVLVVSGAIWGVGLFLLGRQTAPVVEVLDRDGAAHLASLNRIDQALVRGDQGEVLAQMSLAVLPDDPIGRTALELRRARLTELALQQKARAAEEAAKREAALPAAVLRRLHANLWQVDPLDPARSGATSHPAAPIAATPVPEPPPVTAMVPPPPLAELSLAGGTFIPDARIAHPTITGRAYALHPRQGLLRSDDGGQTWRVGLEPLQQLKGRLLAFTSGEQPLLLIREGGAGQGSWLFADREDGFFP